MFIFLFFAFYLAGECFCWIWKALDSILLWPAVSGRKQERSGIPGKIDGPLYHPPVGWFRKGRDWEVDHGPSSLETSWNYYMKRATCPSETSQSCRSRLRLRDSYQAPEQSARQTMSPVPDPGGGGGVRQVLFARSIMGSTRDSAKAWLKSGRRAVANRRVRQAHDSNINGITPYSKPSTEYEPWS